MFAWRLRAARAHLRNRVCDEGEVRQGSCLIACVDERQARALRSRRSAASARSAFCIARGYGALGQGEIGLEWARSGLWPVKAGSVAAVVDIAAMGAAAGVWER